MSAVEIKSPEQWDNLDRLRFVLDRWQDIFDVTVSSSRPKDGSRASSSSREPGSLPEMADDHSIRKIECALTILADREPVLARHLKAYRCNAEWRTADRWTVRRLPSGKRDIVEQRVREKIVPSWVSLAKVSSAEHLLLKLLHGDVSIPRDLWRALTKP